MSIPGDILQEQPRTVRTLGGDDAELRQVRPFEQSSNCFVMIGRAIFMEK